jgi:hypothetical protein
VSLAACCAEGRQLEQRGRKPGQQPGGQAGQLLRAAQQAPVAGNASEGFRHDDFLWAGEAPA